MKLITTLTAVSLMAVSALFAGTEMSKMDDSKGLSQSIMEQDIPLFRANEWSVDAFGTYVFTDTSGRYRDGFGGGAGVNYFFTRYIGVGFDGYAWQGAQNDDAVGAIAGNLILRLPIDKYHFAPYIFAGPGGIFGPINEFSGQAGAGVEVRITHNFGIFADARYVFTTESNDYILPRAGVRFIF
ncbi:MAG: hypothetical protein SGI98_12030 [Verrucomicrobiota bacterium]|nr:hypothetical protein [Verrucomicrobiota bacterium]